MKRKKGFMLIELSIALVVIGLLFAGISGGTVLIENAKVRATLSQIETIKNAANMFNAEYGLPPGGLKNTLNYFPNRIHDGSSFICDRQGYIKELAAEGTGNFNNITSRTKQKTISSKITGYANDLKLWPFTYASIAVCQLHASKYINEPIAGNPNGGFVPNKKYSKSQMGLSLIIDKNTSMILGSFNNEYYIAIGNVYEGGIAKKGWYGEIRTMGGNISGLMLKKLDQKLSTGKADTGNFKSYIANNNESNLVTPSSDPFCKYDSKEKKCLALYQILD